MRAQSDSGIPCLSLQTKLSGLTRTNTIQCNFLRPVPGTRLLGNASA